jgi:DNA repair exonuclease SbcCD ATPase subunit
MLSENYILDALQAERDGEQFPIDFDAVWEGFGYKRKDAARRYLTTRSGLKRLSSKELHRSALTFNQSDKNDKIFLSVESYKFALARAGTDAGAEYLMYLIQIEKQYRNNLERTFRSPEASLNTPPVNPEIKQLNARIAELEAQLGSTESKAAFPKSLEELHEVSGIVNKSQVKKAVIDSFERGIEYEIIDGKVVLTDETFAILVLSLRSHRGTDIGRLPRSLTVALLRFFRYLEEKRKNNRAGTRDKKCPGQLQIPGII